ncbi:MAG: hypothetical protein GC168_19320 [Candidatus Hydrogenedens sp.]|nr:hypothetical protein [Candidatus Hydrogenedens sp.]
MAKRLFYLFVALVWILAAALGLEVYARLELKSAAARAQAWGEPQVEAAFARDAEIIEATAAEAPRPPEALRRDLHSRAEYQDASPADRDALADARQEVLLLCDASGALLTRHGQGQGDLARFCERFQTDGNTIEAFGAAYAEDARRGVNAAAQGSTEPPREYSYDLDGAPYVCEVSIEPWQGGGAPVAIYIRNSMWRDLWKRFRENMYGNNFYDRWPNSEFWTNSHGYRDDEVVVPKPEGAFRILCVGGSTTVEGPRNDLTYPNMLERILKEALPGREIEVVNCGVYTMDTGRELEQFPRYLELEPDLIVVYNFINDLAAVLPGRMASDGSWRKQLRQSVFVLRYLPALTAPAGDDLDALFDETVLGNLQAMVRQGRDAGVQVALCSFAYPTVVRESRVAADFMLAHSQRLWGWSIDTRLYAEIADRFNARLQAWCDAEVVPFAPVADRVTGGLEAFTDICHMHLGAMEAKATAIRDTVLPLIPDKGVQ